MSSWNTQGLFPSPLLGLYSLSSYGWHVAIPYTLHLAAQAWQPPYLFQNVYTKICTEAQSRVFLFSLAIHFINRIARLYYSIWLYQLLQLHRQTMVHSVYRIQLLGITAITVYGFICDRNSWYSGQYSCFKLEVHDQITARRPLSLSRFVCVCVCVCFSPPSITFRDNARISYSFPTTFNSWFTNHRTVGRCVTDGIFNYSRNQQFWN
jgi:hypothetical protein